MLDVRTILKRDIGLQQAMQVAVNLVRNRIGMPSEPVKFLPREEKAFYRQLIEQVIEAFEEGALDKEPASKEESRRRQREAYLTIERQTAHLAAGHRGHEMGPWVNVPDRFDESSACQRCSRVVTLVVSYDPELEITRQGSALDEGCLVSVSEVR